MCKKTIQVKLALGLAKESVSFTFNSDPNKDFTSVKHHVVKEKCPEQIFSFLTQLPPK